MIRSTKFALAFCAAAVAGMVAPAAGAKALPCADYISTFGWQEPDVGHLVGTHSRTETWSYEVAGKPGGVGGATTYTVTVTYEVGIYEMSGGTRVAVDCRDYSLA